MNQRNQIGLFPGVALLLLVAAPQKGRADQNYSQQVFFENSLSPQDYYYSRGHVTAPSTLSLIDDKLPLETATFISGPNALKLQWKSAPDGSWSSELKLYEWRDRQRFFPGSKLFFWVYSVDGIKPRYLPHLALRDHEGNFTRGINLGNYVRELKPRTWTRSDPPRIFPQRIGESLYAPRLNTLILVQGNADATTHTLLLDDIRIERRSASKNKPLLPLPCMLQPEVTSDTSTSPGMRCTIPPWLNM